MASLGGGAILAGMMLGAIAAFIIDRDFRSAAIYAVAGAVLSFFGFIHGAKLGSGRIVRQVALGYLIMAAILIYFNWREGPAPRDRGRAGARALSSTDSD